MEIIVKLYFDTVNTLVLGIYYIVVVTFSDTNKEIMCCKYTEDFNEIATGFTDGTIRLFSCNNGSCTHTLIDDESHTYPGPVTAIKHRPVSKSHPITNMLLSSCKYNLMYKV